MEPHVAEVGEETSVGWGEFCTPHPDRYHSANVTFWSTRLGSRMFGCKLTKQMLLKRNLARLGSEKPQTGSGTSREKVAGIVCALFLFERSSPPPTGKVLFWLS